MPPPVVHSTSDILRRGLELIGLSDRRMQNWRIASLVDYFQLHYGSHPKVYRAIWRDLQETNVPAARVPHKFLNLDYFLLSIFFLRNYPTQKEMVVRFDLCKTTIDRWIWYYVKKIQALKAEKIVWPEAWTDPNNPFVPYFAVSVDGVHCQCYERQTPGLHKDPKVCSHKFKSAGLLYEVAMSIWENKIVHCRGPARAGLQDRTMFRQELMGKLRAMGSKGIADNGYYAEDLTDCLAFPNSHKPKELKTLERRVRTRHETLYTRMKVFKCLKDVHRSKAADRDEKHQCCFEAVLVITQTQFDNGFPLFDAYDAEGLVSDV